MNVDDGAAPADDSVTQGTQGSDNDIVGDSWLPIEWDAWLAYGTPAPNGAHPNLQLSPSGSAHGEGRDREPHRVGADLTRTDPGAGRTAVRTSQPNASLPNGCAITPVASGRTASHTALAACHETNRTATSNRPESECNLPFPKPRPFPPGPGTEPGLLPQPRRHIEHTHTPPFVHLIRCAKCDGQREVSWSLRESPEPGVPPLTITLRGRGWSCGMKSGIQSSLEVESLASSPTPLELRKLFPPSGRQGFRLT